MAPGNTKSDFIGLQRIKIELKKTVTRKGLTENGLKLRGEVVNMASAGDDCTHNGVCATIPIPVLKIPRQSDHSTNDLLAGGDRVGLPDDLRIKSDHQIPHLKSLSMLHLDFIEQQQKQLQTQETQIQKLRSENDTLKCRLERMKRRTLLADKGGDQPQTQANHLIRNQRKESFYKRKRPTVFDLPPTTRKQIAAAESNRCQLLTSTKSSTTTAKGSKQSRIQQNRWVKKDSQLPHRFLQQRGAKYKETKYTGAKDGDDDSVEDCMDEQSYEWTPILYPCLSDLRVNVSDLDLPGGPVLVPSWRHHSVSSSSADTTGLQEDIDDAAFDRRHGKLEVDERKRKRWDIQRIRELREYDRLERKARRRELGVWENTLLSFHPDTIEARKLQVEQTVPIVAFGALVAVNDAGNFDIPWFDAKERESADTKRQTRSRACKK